jgi:hypothetical protein
MGTDPVKMVAQRKKNLPFASQSARFSSLARLTRTQSLLYLLVPTKSAKVAPCPKKFFAQPGPDAQSGPVSALKYPSAHQVGKNDRAGAKKFCLGKIYIPELTALPVAPSNQIGVGYYGVVGQMAGWRG